VLARGSTIEVKLRAGYFVPSPFYIHLPAGHLPSPGEPFLHATAAKLGLQQDKLLVKSSPLGASLASYSTTAAGTAAAAAAKAAT